MPIFYTKTETLTNTQQLYCVIWQKKVSPSNDAIYFSSDHDYILVYAKAKAVWRPQRSGKNERQKDYYKNPDHDPRGDWNSATYTCNKSDVERPNLYYSIVNPNTGEEVWPKKTAVWAYSWKAHEQHVKDNMIYWGKDGKASAPRLKKFFLDVDDVVTRSIWPYSEVGHTQEASGEIAKIFAEVNFATPKPVRLIKRILQIATEEDDIVLDSFAGSGTTAQAVLEINAEDGGNRKFVLIQQKHDSKDDERAHVNICQTITRERVQRVMEGYSFQGTKAETLLEEKVGLNSLRKADELLGRIDAAKEQGRAGYDDVRAEMKEGVVKVEGVKKITERMEGLGGSFTYACVSDRPLFGEFRDLGEDLPAYEELAKYIFYTETSRQWRSGDMNPTTGRIGEHSGTSYYLLYTPNHDADSGLDTPFLKQIAAADPNPRLVVYCEKFWMHRDDLRRWEIAHGKAVRPMIVPFNLK